EVEAEAAEEVGDRRGGEQADRGEEADRLGEAGVAGDAFDHLAVDDADDERDPGGDGEDDRGAADRHRPVAGDPRHLQHRVDVRVGPPLAARPVALLAAEDRHQCLAPAFVSDLAFFPAPSAFLPAASAFSPASDSAPAASVFASDSVVAVGAVPSAAAASVAVGSPGY